MNFRGLTLVGGLVSLSLAGTAAQAAEGMWTLDKLPTAAMQQQFGFAPDQAWTDHVMRSSVRLASGCSGSFVSPDGLVMTNAHCVLHCVRELSSDEQDRVADGFVARERAEEVMCPAEEVNRLEQITDVTAKIGKATKGLSGKAFVDAKHAQIARLESDCVGKASDTVRCDVVELYNGGRYDLYRYARFQDVRLAFSPEYQIGFFGGDPDNFNFPRYNLDMGLLRIYRDGKPVTVEDWFPLNPDGAQEGELAMVTGHPGNTDRLLTVAQLQRLRNVDLIERLTYYSERRALLWQYGRKDADAHRRARTDLTYTENSLKVYRGQLDTLLSPRLMAQKQAQESALRARYVGAPEGDPWAAIESAQAAYVDLAGAYQMLEQERAFYSRYFDFARTLVRAAEELAKPSAERLPEFQDASLPRLLQRLYSPAPIYPDYESTKLAWSLGKLQAALGPDDPVVKLVLANESPETVSAHLVSGTQLGDVAERRRLWDGGLEAVSQSTDPFIQLARAVDAVSRELRSRYEDEVESVENRAAAEISALRFAVEGDSVYPDATFTLRLSYGKVQGWVEHGEPVPPFTTLEGLFGRATGADPFALPPSWLQAKPILDLDARFNFVTTNDIIGGNSGSPVINRDAEVVGLAFDGNRHSIGGSYWFDPELSRAVAVHPAAIVEALGKVYQAPKLIGELLPRD